MNTKKFTLLQLFSIIDGRLSTNIKDVYDILNHITGENLMTHHLPTAMDFIKKVNPVWFTALSIEITTIKSMYENDFHKCIKAIEKDFNLSFDIPSLTAEEKEGFGQFMISNNLLLTMKDDKRGCV